MNNHQQKLVLLCVLLLGCVLTSIGVEYFGDLQKKVIAVPTEFVQKQKSFSNQKDNVQTKKFSSNSEESREMRKNFSNSEKSSSERKSLVNINTATLTELDTLPGVGIATAKKIIIYRETNRFDSIEEIMEVKGIGRVKFSKMKERITVE